MRSVRRGSWGGWIAAALLAGCGGGGNPLSNPDSVENPSGSVAGRKLSYAYFQFCINPIFNADLQVNINGNVSTNKCASSGCHDSVTGNGGSFRLVGSATNGTVTATSEAERTALRATPMYQLMLLVIFAAGIIKSRENENNQDKTTSTWFPLTPDLQ